MGSNRKITIGFLIFCSVGVLAAIAMCAFERVQDAAFFGMVTAGIAVVGLYFGFESWKEEPKKEPEAAVLSAEGETPSPKNPAAPLCAKTQENPVPQQEEATVPEEKAP